MTSSFLRISFSFVFFLHLLHRVISYSIVLNLVLLKNAIIGETLTIPVL